MPGWRTATCVLWPASCAHEGEHAGGVRSWYANAALFGSMPCVASVLSSSFIAGPNSRGICSRGIAR
jgi:hypothetical protein